MENHGGVIPTRENLILPPELFANPYQQSHLVARQEELQKEMMHFAFVPFSYFEGIFKMLLKLTTWGRRLYFPSEGRRTADFYCP
jgi:hypothetical protein